MELSHTADDHRRIRLPRQRDGWHGYEGKKGMNRSANLERNKYLFLAGLILPSLMACDTGVDKHGDPDEPPAVGKTHGGDTTRAVERNQESSYPIRNFNDTAVNEE
jgi:hypothetical protein